MLDANRAERAKRAERKANKANGIDRPAQSDDENRDIGTVIFLFFKYMYSSLIFIIIKFSSHSVVTKQAAKKAALVQRDGKVPPTLLPSIFSNVLQSGTDHDLHSEVTTCPLLVIFLTLR